MENSRTESSSTRRANWTRMAVTAIVGAALGTGGTLGVSFLTWNRDLGSLESSVQRLQADVRELGSLRSSVQGLQEDVQELGSLRSSVQGLQEDVRELGSLRSSVQRLQEDVQKAVGMPPGEVPPFPPKSPVPLPLGAWKPQGPGAVKLSREDSRLVFEVDLKGSGDFAELFLDLEGLSLTPLKPNADRTYNLVGKKISALVKASEDFKGEVSYPNGVQFILKDSAWQNHDDTWTDATDELTSEEGKCVELRVPDHAIARNTRAITLKFTIGTDSSASYRGRFYIQDMGISNSE